MKELSDYVVSRMDDINSRLSYEISDNNDEVREEIDIIYEKSIDWLNMQIMKKVEYGNIMALKTGYV